MQFVTASGEKIQSVNELRVEAKDENGMRVALGGRLTDVKKPLLSAAGVEEKGNDVFLSETGRYIIWKRSPAQREIRGGYCANLGQT